MTGETNSLALWLQHYSSTFGYNLDFSRYIIFFEQWSQCLESSTLFTPTHYFAIFSPVEACSDWWYPDQQGTIEWRHQAGTCDTCISIRPSDSSESIEKIKSRFVNCLPFQLTGISKSLKYFPATRMCCKRGLESDKGNLELSNAAEESKATHINSQSKQHIVSPVKKRLSRCARWSLILLKCASRVLFFASSFFTRTSFNLEYKFSISVATSLSCTNKLWPPGTLFMICRSILSFSRIARPPSIRIGGWVASKFVRKSGGGFCMSTVVT